MFARSLALLVLSLAAVACAGPTQTSSSATAPPVVPVKPSSSLAGASTIELHRAPANLGCDSIGVDYTSMTFHIDPGAVDPVIALTNKGTTLMTYWSDGFVAGPDRERVIRDAAGRLVVSDGDPLLVPAAAYPRLAGYFVCLAQDAIYVLDTDPS